MFRVITALLITLALTGCMDSISKLSEPVDTSYYTVDLKDYEYCRGNTKQCLSMTLIGTGLPYFKPIEEAYSQKLSGKNSLKALIHMLLTSENAKYPIVKDSENGRYYRLGANKQTDTVWKTLKHIEESLYNPKRLID
ncbi:hypothetical protein [Amphritea pacifica]|uniref:Lipoprotein n=1 Tax=Amphritea pacifica TaxID=2811233 RepID=A0ABS2W5R0_9GAMM|nr:hypothetical protein [Amphritea pacifica]MBN0987053.1 hypothetical protein [Amphritea pacifica]MBN1006400.1 hypothetical protein [Amphritea pacifica]